ncbi:hypothetical protein SERLA73DRAFT_19403, partial [Serpula lacrymans var. lacrymans S7.3]
TKKIPRPIPVYNTDGTLNKDGAIKEFIELRMSIEDHEENIHFAVTSLGSGRMFLGHEWLTKHNPTIDWKKSEL